MSLEALVARGSTTGSLPTTGHLPPLDVEVLRRFQPLALAGLRKGWDVRVHGRSHIPTRGPVIIAANHVGTLDGPLVVMTAGRPTFALAKNELFSGAVGRLLRLGGQIPLHRDFADFPALRKAVQVLRDGHVLAIFPEGLRDCGTFAQARGGTAYLALVTGAPIVPCAFLGTRLRGAGRKALPPRGSRIDVVYGGPITIGPVPWPRRRQQVADATEFLRERLAAHVAGASRWARMEMPGPVE